MPEGPSSFPDPSFPEPAFPEPTRAGRRPSRRAAEPVAGSLDVHEVPSSGPQPGPIRWSRPAPGTRPIERIQPAQVSSAQVARPQVSRPQDAGPQHGGPRHAGPSPQVARPQPAAPQQPAPSPPFAGPFSRPAAGSSSRPAAGPSVGEVFATVPARAARSAPAARRSPRPPGTPYRGFRQPRPSGQSRLPLVAGTLTVLIVLGGIGYGLQRLTSGTPGPSVTGVSDPSSAVVAGGVDPQKVPGTVSAQTVKPPKAASATVRTGAEAKVKLGVFLGTSPSGVRSFGQWLGREPDYAIDFSSRSTWSDIYNPSYAINTWRGSDYRMVYSVALLPWNGNTSIKAGSRGEYDEYYRRLARNLVAGGQEDAILRLGWEFNLKGWKWSTDNPEEFIGYWRHIVTAMRSVPGQKLQFDWNPNIGETPYEAHRYYPGGKYVDYVGVDVYDVSWTKATYPYGSDCEAVCRRYRQEEVWDRILNGHYGLVYWSEFARSKGKPMSIPEWGLWDRPDGHGGGDNPYFIQQMHAFIDDPQNRVAYQAYLQVDVDDGQHKLTTLKRAGKMYKKLFK